MTAPRSIILASSSPRRQELLRGLGVSFIVQPSGVTEEVHEPVQPGQYVEILAKRKAGDVASRNLGENALVLGADTVVVLDEEILGKPRDKAHAFDMLKRLQGRTHTVFSGLSLVEAAQHSDGRTEFAFHDVTTHTSTQVTMRSMSDDEIHAYIASGEPMDKAGAYGIQGIGSTLVSEIHGDYFTVVGLPLCLLGQMLKKKGITLL